METLSIGLIQPELWVPRGGEKHVCKLAYELRRQGHEVTVYTFRKNNDRYPFDWLLKDCQVIELGTPAFTRPFAPGMPRLLHLSRELAHRIGHHDILNGHNFPSEWVAGFTSLPSVWLCNDPPVFAPGQHKALLDPYYAVFRELDRRLLRRTHTIACLSQLVRRELRKIYPSKELVVVGAGAELDHAVRHVGNKSIDILAVGPLDHHKRPLDILEAAGKLCATHPNLQLHFVGSGPLEAALEQHAKRLRIPVRLYGNVSDRQLYRLYSLADLAVHASDLEPWGIFPMEAILAGIPTILSDRVGCADVLQGMPLFPYRNLDALAQQLRRVIEERGRFLKITEKNRRLLQKEYTWKRHAERMLELFKREMGRTSPHQNPDDAQRRRDLKPTSSNITSP